MLFDLFAIATGLKFWHELLIAMFDVNALYWNILWGGFILLGAVAFGLGCYLLQKRKGKRLGEDKDDESEKVR